MLFSLNRGLLFQESMGARGILLSEVNDRRILEKIVKREVFDSKGAKIGYIWKIYIAKKTKQPLKVVIKRQGGELLEVQPEKLRLINKRIVLADQTHEGAVAILERLYEIAEELKQMKNELMVLGERCLVAREISYDQYIAERRVLEKKRLMLKLEAYTLLDALTHLLQEEGVKLSREEEQKLLYSLDVLKSNLPVIPTEKLRELFSNTTI